MRALLDATAELLAGLPAPVVGLGVLLGVTAGLLAAWFL